jgi:nonsense-mediated mRNA decay protein 3
VECGKEVESEDELIGSLCLDCFIERNPLVSLPDQIDVVRCPACGATYGRGGWGLPRDPAVEHDIDQASIEDAGRAAEGALMVVEGGLVGSVEVQVTSESRSVLAVDVEVEVSLMGRLLPAHASTRVRIRGEMCPPCSRRAGQYYEALVQLRGTKERPATPKELDRARAFVTEEVNRLAAQSRDVALVRQEEIHGGLDFYFTSQSAASMLAKGLCGIFSASSSTSTTMAGRRDGKEVVRVTHSVRLPDLRRGDYVLLRGQMLRVVSASSKDVAVEPAAGEGRRRHLGRLDIQQIAFVGDADATEEAVLVSTSETEAQVLDPVSYTTVDVMLPEGFDPEGRETVRVVRSEDNLYIVG